MFLNIFVCPFYGLCVIRFSFGVSFTSLNLDFFKEFYLISFVFFQFYQTFTISSTNAHRFLPQLNTVASVFHHNPKPIPIIGTKTKPPYYGFSQV